MIKTKKVFIHHIDTMKPLAFLYLMNSLLQECEGVLNKNTVHITEKVDGSAFKIGVNSAGGFFIESATSLPTYGVGDFYRRDIEKGYTGAIGKIFDDLLKSFSSHVDIQKVLKTYNHNGVKVIGEILYMPMGHKENGKVRFVRIGYDEDKLGTEWAFVPFAVIDGEGHPHPDECSIIQALVKLSTKERKIATPELFMVEDVDLSFEIRDLIATILLQHPNYEEVLLSRKHVHADEKRCIAEKIAPYQVRAAQKILQAVPHGIFGDDIEGVVVKTKNGTMIKIVTDTFKNNKHLFKA